MTRAVKALAAIVLLGGIAWLVWGPPDILSRIDREMLERMVAEAGALGPVLVILLMAFAVVASPVPSAPIALVSGALYGHVWGTLWVLIGAEAGALIAFALARHLGQDVMRAWFGDRLDRGLLGSQTTLSLVVFASRLMPFVSFDLVSYAAGLSVLHFWRFALATLAGIAPASFILAHLGSEAATGGADALDWALALGLGLLTGAPLIWAAFRGKGKTG